MSRVFPLLICLGISCSFEHQHSSNEPEAGLMSAGLFSQYRERSATAQLLLLLRQHPSPVHSQSHGAGWSCGPTRTPGWGQLIARHDNTALRAAQPGPSAGSPH